MNQSIINLNKMCSSAKIANLGDVLDEIYTSLKNTEASKSVLTESQIALLNKMCTSAQNVQLGTLISNIIASSASETHIDELTTEQVALLNKMCISAKTVEDEEESISGLGSLLQWCIQTINDGIIGIGTKILSYSLGVEGEIVDIQDDDSILITLPAETVIGTYTPTFTLSKDATAKINEVEQTSGVSEVNFGAAEENTVQYDVEAEDGVSSQLWNVKVQVAVAANYANVVVLNPNKDEEDMTLLDNDSKEFLAQDIEEK